MEKKKEPIMIREQKIEQFRETGLLLLINQILHIFGWAIVVEFNKKKKPVRMYPARVKFRGFDVGSQDIAYKKITKYMVKNSKKLSEEID